MIDAKNNFMQPDVRPLSGWHRAWSWSFLVILALVPITAFAEDGMESIDSVPPSALSVELDLSSMPEPEIQARLAEVSAELSENLAELHRLKFQLQQSGRAQELAAEIKQIRRAIGELYESQDQAPEPDAQPDPRLLALRGELNEKEAESLGLLNQSEAYRALADRAEELRELLKSILAALQQVHPDDNAGKPL